MSRDIYYDLCTFIDKLKASRGRKKNNNKHGSVYDACFCCPFLFFVMLTKFSNMYAMAKKKKGFSDRLSLKNLYGI